VTTSRISRMVVTTNSLFVIEKFASLKRFARRFRHHNAMQMSDSDLSGPDEDMYALEGMYMPNPGEYPPVKFPFDETNTVRQGAEKLP